jgi:hypothetical protein
MVLSSMELLAATIGSEGPDYVRANVIYSACHAKNEEDFLGNVADAIVRLEYQHGRKHPNIVRAVRRYVKLLRDRGDEGKLAEIEEKFGATCSSK